MNKTGKPEKLAHKKIMETIQKKTGFSLLEMMVVLAIIVITTMMALRLGPKFDLKTKKNQTNQLFLICNNALEVFADYKYVYKTVDPNYINLSYPIDCTGFDEAVLKARMKKAEGLNTIEIIGNHNDDFASSEVLYWLLYKVPQCKKILSEIDENLITAVPDGEPMNSDEVIMLTEDTQKPKPFYRIVDPWGTPIKYDYYDETNGTGKNWAKKIVRTFPILTSAGPDKIFGTSDDITSR